MYKLVNQGGNVYKHTASKRRREALLAEGWKEVATADKREPVEKAPKTAKSKSSEPGERATSKSNSRASAGAGQTGRQKGGAGV